RRPAGTPRRSGNLRWTDVEGRDLTAWSTARSAGVSHPAGTVAARINSAVLLPVGQELPTSSSSRQLILAAWGVAAWGVAARGSGRLQGWRSGWTTSATV